MENVAWVKKRLVILLNDATVGLREPLAVTGLLDLYLQASNVSGL